MKDFADREALFLLIRKLQERDFCGIKFYIREDRRKELEVRQGKPEFSVEACEQSCFVEAGKNGKRCCCFFDSPKEWESIVDFMEEAAFVSQQSYEYVPLSGDDCCRLEAEIEADMQKDEAEIEADIQKDETEIEVDMQKEDCFAGLLEGEKAALGYRQIDFLENCRFAENRSQIILMDENGRCMIDRDGYRYVFMEAVAREEDSTSIGRAGSYGSQAEDFSFQKLGRLAAERAIHGLHAGSIVSGEYPVILKNHVAAEILEAFLPAFYGDRIHNGLSSLHGKEGVKIGISGLNLTEEPGHPLGRCRRRIDDEGVPVSRKYLIHQGVLKQAIYNRASAQKAGRKSTGNGFKTDSSQDISVGITNILLSTDAGQEKALEDMISCLKNGLLVSAVSGVFAGADADSGDFSLLASGNVIQEGKIGQAFCQAVISGNLFEVFQRIEAIGNDPAALGPDLSCVISPSIQIKSLIVSGY